MMAKHTETFRAGLVMAGGTGERLWPLSRTTRPKQLLALEGEGQSFLASVVDRVAPLIPSQRLFVMTGSAMRDVIRDGLPDFPSQNIVPEPCKRNTAACVALGMARVMAQFPQSIDNGTLAILTADHHVGSGDDFRQTLETVIEAAEENDALTIIGMQPTRPEPAFGYIETAEEPFARDAAHEALPVLRFREKPNRETAEDFIATGRFLWNTGMLFARMPVLLREMEAAMPEMAAATLEMKACFESAGDDCERRIAQIFQELPNISIDYGVIEKSPHVMVVPSRMDWDDFGAWDAVTRVYPRDAEGNIARGDPVLLDTRDCVVYNAEGADRLTLATVGLEGMTVVATRDAVLVCPTDRAQDVRKLVQLLHERGALNV